MITATLLRLNMVDLPPQPQWKITESQSFLSWLWFRFVMDFRNLNVSSRNLAEILSRKLIIINLL